MRTFILFILLMPLAAFAQDGAAISYTHHDTLQGDAFSKAALWAASTFNSPNSDVLMSDRTSGAIVYKASFEYSNGNPFYSIYDGQVNYTVKILVSGQAVEVTFGNFNHVSSVPRASLGAIKTEAPRLSNAPSGVKMIHADIVQKCADVSRMFHSLD